MWHKIVSFASIRDACQKSVSVPGKELSLLYEIKKSTIKSITVKIGSQILHLNVKDLFMNPCHVSQVQFGYFFQNLSTLNPDYGEINKSSPCISMDSMHLHVQLQAAANRVYEFIVFKLYAQKVLKVSTARSL